MAEMLNRVLTPQYRAAVSSLKCMLKSSQLSVSALLSAQISLIEESQTMNTNQEVSLFSELLKSP